MGVALPQSALLRPFVVKQTRPIRRCVCTHTRGGRPSLRLGASTWRVRVPRRGTHQQLRERPLRNRARVVLVPVRSKWQPECGTAGAATAARVVDPAQYTVVAAHQWPTRLLDRAAAVAAATWRRRRLLLRAAAWRAHDLSMRMATCTRARAHRR